MIDIVVTERRVAASSKPELVRALNLPLTVLFGLGVTVGAGIYVLIGATAGRAGMHAPLAFLLAAVVMAPTAATFAELASRMPVSAGEAAYVKAGFGSENLARLVGLMVIVVGIISAAAIAKGSAGYIQSVAISPDGRRILSAGSDNAVRLWDAGVGKEIRKLEGHRDQVWHVAFSRDGRLAISSGQDNSVRLWTGSR